METENETPESLAQKVQLLSTINSALAFKPDLIKLFPHIEPLIGMLEIQLDKILGNNEKMIVIARRNGVSRAVVLDTKIDFTINNNMVVSPANKDIVIHKYEKEALKNKLLDSIVMQTLREKYEKMGGAEMESGDSPFDSLFNMIPK